MVFDIRLRPYAETLVRNLYISLEAMRGHLVLYGHATGMPDPSRASRAVSTKVW